MRRRASGARLGWLPLLAALTAGHLPTPLAAQAGGRDGGEAVPVADTGDPTEEARAFFRSVLQDATLDRLIAEAYEGNPGLKAVEARIEAAHADRFRTTLDLAPAVTASGAYTRQRISSASFPGLSGSMPDQGFWEAGVRLSWEVDVFGRTRSSLAGRAALVDASVEDLGDARVLLSAEVAGTYYRLRGAQDRLEVARRNAANQERTLALTVERLEAGRGTALDTERARAQLSSTEAALPALEAAVAAEQHRIAVLLGREPGAVVDAPVDGAPPPDLPRDVPPADAGAIVARRPDVVGARRRVDADRSFVSSAKAGYLPRISVEGAAGYTATDIDGLGGTGTPRYVVGPVISWPFLDMGRVKADVDEARARQIESRARYDAAVLGALEDVETSRVAYLRARERLGNLEEAAAASERAADLARLRFEEGAGDFLEVLDAERRVLEAQDRLSTGRTDATTALVSLYRALGGTWTEPIGGVDRP